MNRLTPDSSVSRRLFLQAAFAIGASARAGSPTGVPAAVAMGVLTLTEFEALTDEDREMVETTARRLVDSYGLPWCVRERARLRDELSFCYGLPAAASK